MRLIYAGTPDFAVPALNALIAAGHEIALVLTQPDRPAGRGMQPAFSAVKQAAQQHGLPLYQPLRLDTAEQYGPLQTIQPDAIVVAAYGLILPQTVLDTGRLGAFNIHASLLPRWRGAAPIQRAILAGDKQTGVCIMRMEAGLDTGPVLTHETITIEDEDSGGSLHDKLSRLGARLIGPALQAYAEGKLGTQAQADEGVTYAAKISKAEARIDWTQSAEQIDRHIRAFNPVPGASARIAQTDIKVWAARIAAPGESAASGTVLKADERGVEVACTGGNILLTSVQRPGARRLAAKEFLQGFALKPGQRFDPRAD